MRHIIVISAILIGLAACTAAERKELDTDMEKSDAMEAKARSYCSVTQGYEIGGKTYMQCTQHYVQGLMDAEKKK